MTRSRPDRKAAVSICDERKGKGRDFRDGVKRGLPPGSAPVSRPARDFAPCLSIAPDARCPHKIVSRIFRTFDPSATRLSASFWPPKRKDRPRAAVSPKFDRMFCQAAGAAVFFFVPRQAKKPRPTKPLTSINQVVGKGVAAGRKVGAKDLLPARSIIWIIGGSV